MEKVFFTGWESVVRTGITTVLAYLILILLLRGSGKRTLSKMNAFDFVVTVALGSTLASVSLNKSVPLADGVAALFLLIFLQYLITWLSVRSNTINQLVKSTPALLVYQGKMLHDAMRKERVTTDEINAFLRRKGLTTVADAGAIVMETDGTLTLLEGSASAEHAVLEKVSKPERIP